jgi:hypothetical protein
MAGKRARKSDSMSQRRMRSGTEIKRARHLTASDIPNRAAVSRLAKGHRHDGLRRQCSAGVNPHTLANHRGTSPTRHGAQNKPEVINKPRRVSHCQRPSSCSRQASIDLLQTSNPTFDTILITSPCQAGRTQRRYKRHLQIRTRPHCMTTGVLEAVSYPSVRISPVVLSNLLETYSLVLTKCSPGRTR